VRSTEIENNGLNIAIVFEKRKNNRQVCRKTGRPLRYGTRKEISMIHHHPGFIRRKSHIPAAAVIFGFAIWATFLCSASHGQVSLPMDMSAWTRNADRNAPIEATGEGLVLHGAAWTNGRVDSNGYSDGNAVSSLQTFDYLPGTTRCKFKIHGAGAYLAVFAEPQGFPFRYYTTHHSWDGSSVIPEDTWLYATYRIQGGQWSVTLSRSDYDDRGGPVLHRHSGALTDAQITAFQDRPFTVSFGDNYGGAQTYLVLGEVTIPGQPVDPQPALTAPQLDLTFTGTTAILTWSQVPGATEYVLAAGFASGIYLAEIGLGNIHRLEIPLSALADADYYVGIKARNSSRQSPLSNEVRILKDDLRIRDGSTDSSGTERVALRDLVQQTAGEMVQAIVLLNSVTLADMSATDAETWVTRLTQSAQALDFLMEDAGYLLQPAVASAPSPEVTRIREASASPAESAIEIEGVVNDLNGSRGQAQLWAQRLNVDARVLRNAIEEHLQRERQGAVDDAQRMAFYERLASLVQGGAGVIGALALAVGGVVMVAGSAPVSIPASLLASGMLLLGGTTAIVNTGGLAYAVIDGQDAPENVVITGLNQVTSILGVANGDSSDAVLYVIEQVGPEVDLETLSRMGVVMEGGRVLVRNCATGELTDPMPTQPIPFLPGSYVFPDGTRVNVTQDSALRDLRHIFQRLPQSRTLIHVGQTNDPAQTPVVLRQPAADTEVTDPRIQLTGEYRAPDAYSQVLQVGFIVNTTVLVENLTRAGNWFSTTATLAPGLNVIHAGLLTSDNRVFLSQGVTVNYTDSAASNEFTFPIRNGAANVKLIFDTAEGPVLRHEEVTETYGGYAFPYHYFNIDTGTNRMVRYEVTGALIGTPSLVSSSTFYNFDSPSAVSANPFNMTAGRYFRLTIVVEDPSLTSGRATERFYFALQPRIQ
jgi:hypothetical protein